MSISAKRWHFAGVVTEDAVIGAAILQASYMGYAFAYAVDRPSGRVRRFELKTPLALGVDVSRSPQGASRFTSVLGSITFDPAAQRLDIAVPAFQAQLSMAPGQPHAAAWRVPTGGEHRTEKRMGAKAAGTLKLDGETRSIEGRALVDWSSGEPGRETDWRWAVGAGRAGESEIAWNLRTGFGDPWGLENAVWVDGVPHAAGPAVIEPGGAWRIEAAGLTLAFRPEGAHREDLNLGVLASRYGQFWGAFEGSYEGVPLQGTGLAEDHWARW